MTKDAPGIPKILPKPTELLPGLEAREDALVQNFNTNGLSPYADPDDPDVREAQNAFEAAQKRVREVTARKAMLKLVAAGDAPDPEKVAELCEKEPWKTGGLNQLNKSLMGFVPEKFEALALQKPEGSPERERLMAARDEARAIYWQQMKVLLRQTCAKFDGDALVKNKRTLYEPLSSKLWAFAQSIHENPAYEQQYGRIMWMALNLGEEYMNKYGRSKAFGPGYQQYSLRLETDETGPEPVV